MSEIAIEITPQELLAASQTGELPVLLDVREPWEWNQVRLEGCIHIPMDQVPARMHELDRQRPLVVICAHGVRSYQTAVYLNRQGFQARSLQGGLAAWPRQQTPAK